MNNEFSIISYNEEDLHLISIAKIHSNIFDIHAGTMDPMDSVGPMGPIIQDNGHTDIVELILKIGNCLSIDVFNKKVEYIPDVSLSVIFTEKTVLNDDIVDIIIDNKDIYIPFQLTIIENNKVRYVEIDSINYIIDNKSIGGINNIIINSFIYRNFMIINHEFKQTVDKLYDSTNNDKIITKIITEEEEENNNIFNSIHISFKMSNDDIITFIDNLLIDINIKNIDFTVDKWYKTDFIIIRTLNDLIAALIKNLLENYKTVYGHHEQIKEIKYLMKICTKYCDNIKLLDKCSITGKKKLYNTIVMKSLEFYHSTNSIECFLCFAKFMPEYCNNNHYPIPLIKRKISDEYEKELLDDDNLRELYINNKHLL